MHVGPFQPGVHSHWKASRRSRHTAPLRQGALAQSSASSSQRAPVQPRSHAHAKPAGAAASEHAPCAHGCGAHGLSTRSQSTPEKPSAHVHRYWSGAVFSQVPPCWQGSCVPQ